MKQIKKLQAPIEVSTHDQVEIILELGVFYISSIGHQDLHSTDKIVNLKIKDSTKSEKDYTFSDLKDLEGKIILIRDSGIAEVNGQHLEIHSSEDIQNSAHEGSNSHATYSLEKSKSVNTEKFLSVRM